jgi:hypothetical protein
MKIKFNDTEYCIIGGFSINKSSREVTFSDIVIDFSTSTITDLPLKLQEVEILEDDVVVFYGYIDSFQLPEFDKEDIVLKLNITLMSPLALLSRRTATINGFYSLSDGLDIILAPLLVEGFTVKELNIPNNTINFNFISESIEYILNYLSNTQNLWYYVDELKQITINSIDYQFGKEPVLDMTTTNYKEIENIKSIKPMIKSVDYANIINAKNVLVYENTSTKIFDVPKTLKNGDSVEFNYLVGVSQNDCKRNFKGFDLGKNAIYIYGNDGSNNFTGQIQYVAVPESYTVTNISYDTDSNTVAEDFILIKDSFFKNAVKGLKWNGTNPITISDIEGIALIPSTMKFINSNEIDLNKGKINTSGIIEKTVDLNNRWFTKEELIDYMRSILSINTNQTDEIELKFKGQDLNKYDIGDSIIIDIPELFTQGSFVVTDSSYSKNNITTEELMLKLRTSNILENFIDIFRAKEKEENETQVLTEYVADYVSIANMKQTTSVEVMP